MGSVTLLVPYSDRWYFAEVLRGATERIRGAGHDVIVHVIPPSETSARVAADAVQADFAAEGSLGAIAAGFKYHAEQATRIATWHRPVVVIGGSVIGLPTVMIDDVGAAMMATSHLLSLGHTRIAHLAGTLSGQMDFSVHSRRARGYRNAMGSAGLEPSIVEADFDPDAAYSAAKQLLSGPERPTAVFAVSDEMAFAVLAAARDLDLRPGADVSVVGIDDHPRAETEGLTTVRQHPSDIGATAADLLLGGLQHDPDPKQSRLQPIALITRTSTSRLRHA